MFFFTLFAMTFKRNNSIHINNLCYAYNNMLYRGLVCFVPEINLFVFVVVDN